ncbi:hypothetical protein [Halomicrobium salinisoli]|uniref:hypothetical protein n=1 Tax=Halomicrobium salinisoli TaxID=2878391 RepID=UPI001CF018E0|nr:hypothetical protein [Halomicrobium salinisoli]
MNGRYVAAALAAVALVAAAGVGSAVAGVGPAAGLFAGEEHPPALLGFESTGAHCTDDFMANSSTAVSGGGANTEITHSQNISLPDTAYAVGGPTFERLNETTYVLSVPTEATDAEARDCAAYARYEARMRIPAGDDPWRVIVEHDDETATTLFGDANSAGASGSASGGARVSE